MDSKQKKTVILLFAVIGILIVLIIVAALILNKKKQNTQGGDTPTSNVELIYWGLWEPAEVMQPIIDKYESENPGVKILYSQQAFRNYESRVYTRLEQSSSSTEPAPDIIRINNTWLPKFQKYLEPLPTSILSAQEYAEEFYPTALDDFTGSDGKIYAIPWEIDGLAVIYNKQLLTEAGYTTPPQDWDSFVEAAQKLTKRDSSGRITQAGLAIGTSENISHSADILAFLMLQNGASIINSSRNKVSLTSERAVSALKTYSSFAQGEKPLWAPYLASDLTTFFQGKLAMMFGPSWRIFDIVQAAPQIELGVAPLPQLPNNDPVYYAMYWGDTVSKASSNTEQAWKFVNFLSQPEQQKLLFSNASKIRAFGEPYSRVSLNSDLLENPYTNAIAEMAPAMKSWQMGDQSYVEELIRGAITQVSEGKGEPKSVLGKAEEDINNQLAVTNK
ncbi:MAG: ABC transporter substrate-binding protein [Candidatus Dojkabacteria bacterium]|jgi:multiple sugar transport system substrate-binding protein